MRSVLSGFGEGKAHLKRSFETCARPGNRVETSHDSNVLPAMPSKRSTRERYTHHRVRRPLAHTTSILRDPTVSPSSAPWSGALLGLLLDPGAMDRAVRGSKRLLWELTSPRKAWEHQDGLVSLHVGSLPALPAHETTAIDQYDQPQKRRQPEMRHTYLSCRCCRRFQAAFQPAAGKGEENGTC